MTKFKKYVRFDADEAAKGVKHAIRDDAGNYYGTFTTSLFDPYSKFIQVETERFNRENADDLKAKGDKAHVYAFVEICVQDWADVLDEAGKAVAFSKEAAFEYLTDEDMAWAANKLISETQDVANYKADPQANKAAISGN
jgi:hypothetical protein